MIQFYFSSLKRMEHLKFFNGQEMPAIGLGLWQIDDPVIFEKSVETALGLGYRHFDIAYTYKNETQLGKILKKWLDSGKIKREELFITTKLPQIGMTKDRVEYFLKKSLESLQLSYVDLYLIHFPVGFTYVNDDEVAPKGPDGNILIDYETDLESVWKKMEEQVGVGRAKNIGLSNFNSSQIERVVNFAKIQPSCLQIELNVYLQQRELLEVCKKNKIAVVGYGNFGSPGRTIYFKKSGRTTSEFICPPVLEDPMVIEIGRFNSKSPSQILLRYLIQIGVGCIPSSSDPLQLQQNIQVFDFKLNDSEMKMLKSLDQGESARSFRMEFFKGAELHKEFPFPRKVEVKVVKENNSTTSAENAHLHKTEEVKEKNIVLA